jgi:hypothetical protein
MGAGGRLRFGEEVAARGLQFSEEAATFGGGVVVILGDGEVEGLLKPAAGVIGAGELETGVAEEKTGHEPVGAAGGAFLEMFDGFGGEAFLKERLAEAEAEEEVVRLGGDAVAEGGGAHKREERKIRRTKFE